MEKSISIAKLATLYAAFAAVATVANIGSQDITTRLYDGPFHIAASIIVGTGVGLVVKYILDKRYIFRYQTKNLAHDGKTFALYTVMGLVTTVIFWGFEFGFEHLFGTKRMRYVGGVIGLAIGYIVKYHLDKRYVFNVREN